MRNPSLPLPKRAVHTRLRARRQQAIKWAAGYTLLEVISAVGIAAVLLLAIYYSVDFHFRTVIIGRNDAQMSQSIRTTTNLIRTDLRNAFTQWKPAGGNLMGDLMGGGGTAGGASTGTSGASSGGSAGSGTGGSSADGSSASTSSQTSPSSVAPGGVFGTNTVVGVITKVDVDEIHKLMAENATLPMSDLRFVRYWVATVDAPSADGKTGLMRDVLWRVPNDLLNVDPLNYRTSQLIAPEVKQMQVLYYDGSSWYSEWPSDMTQPPLQIEITLLIEKPGQGQKSLTGTVGGPNVVYVEQHKVLVNMPDLSAFGAEE